MDRGGGYLLVLGVGVASSCVRGVREAIQRSAVFFDRRCRSYVRWRKLEDGSAEHLRVRSGCSGVHLVSVVSVEERERRWCRDPGKMCVSRDRDEVGFI